MLITCWSSKGGSGTTVVAAALALLAAADAGSALLVDLAGDLPAALGLPEPSLGLSDWDGGVRSLARLEVAVGSGLRLLPRGRGPLSGDLGRLLAVALGGASPVAPVVVDGGVMDTNRAAAGLARDVVSTSLLVIRPCFLALRRAVAAAFPADGVVVVDEPHRSLGASDIEAALGRPIVAVVPWDPATARRVDAGLLGAGLPKTLARALRPVMRVQSA